MGLRFPPDTVLMSSARGSDTWATIGASQGAGAAATYEKATEEPLGSWMDTTGTATIEANAATRATAHAPRRITGTSAGWRVRAGRIGRTT